jgi:hypothetical protein
MEAKIYSFKVGVLVGAVLILQAIGNMNCDTGVHSIYIHVYGRILRRFLSVMATFAPLFLSFAVVFNIIFPKVITCRRVYA